MFKYLLYLLFERAKKTMAIGEEKEDVYWGRISVLISLTLIPSFVLSRILDRYGIIEPKFETKVNEVQTAFII